MALKPARLQWSGDGSLASLDYDDVYFQRGKGMGESRYVFIDGNRLPERFATLKGSFHIAEAGFGSGLNFLLTAKLFADTAPQSARLAYTSFEKHPIPLADLEKIYAHFGELGAFTSAIVHQYPPMIEGFHTLQFLGGRIKLMLVYGDIAQMLPQVNGTFDAWYLDGFTPSKNTDMWQEKLFPLIAARTKAGGTLATFSSAGHVRRALAAAGFQVKKINGYGSKWAMTVAAMVGETPATPAPKNIAVLGAGIAGCSAAYALAQRGHNISLIDRHDDCAAETSGNPVGIVYPKMTVDASKLGIWHGHAFSFTRNLVKSLALSSWRECGVTHLDSTNEERERTKILLEKNEFPLDYALFDNGLRQPMAGLLSPPEFCHALAGNKNIRKVFSTAIETLEHKDGKWFVNAVEYDAVVIALGHGCKALAQTAWLPLQSLRGQITLLKPTDQSRNLETVLCHEGYISPLQDGLHCIGATFQKEEPLDAETRSEDDAENLEKLNLYLPQYGFTQDHIADSRSGYRAMTGDRLPMAGPCPDHEKMLEDFAGLRAGKTIGAEPARHDGLYLCTGFGAHGMTGAPLAGEFIAAQISGEPLPVPQDLISHLMPERFILRDLKRRKI